MDKMNIPKTIRVGYQERNDTYTGKLAYIIYIDGKGKVRKETSWESWRDEELGSEDFKNEPTEGFVLNKSGGGARQCYSWNPRNEFIRVYDPRGFEFEISVANLLYILQECTSTKGKGLEGEFVYGWDGTSLVLLPIGTKEYKQSIEFTDLQIKKIKRKDMAEGLTYQFKDMSKMVYLGRHNCQKDPLYDCYNIKGLIRDLKLPLTKRYDIFYDLDRKKFQIETGLNKVATEINNISPNNYPELYLDFLHSPHVSRYKEIKLIPITLDDILNSRIFYSHINALIKIKDKFQLLEIRQHGYTSSYYRRSNSIDSYDLDSAIFSKLPHITDKTELKNKFKDSEFFTIKIKLESDRLIDLCYFIN